MGHAGTARGRELSAGIAADHWRVASYGYPNPFVHETKADLAWETLLSFFGERSYRALKRYWEKHPRQLDSHATESWKSAFEEFGLLWVPAGSDRIEITPAGRQLRAAVDAGDEERFLWIGLSLLLRFPLRGPRRPKGPLHQRSDLLPYWFLLAAMRELRDYLWWSELTRVIAQVFRVNDAVAAVDAVRALREGRVHIDDFPRAGVTERGAVYNDLNQVLVHASLNWVLMSKDHLASPYAPPSPERKHWLRTDCRYIIDRSLAIAIGATECDEATDLVRRMPRAPVFASEGDYFAYLGAEVPAMPPAAAPVSTVVMGGEIVPILRVGDDCQREGASTISGSLESLCRLAREQRVILSDDLVRSYLVEDKQRRDGGVVVRLRRARQISDAEVVKAILEGGQR